MSTDHRFDRASESQKLKDQEQFFNNMSKLKYFLLFLIWAGFFGLGCSTTETPRVPTARETATDGLINDGKQWIAAGGTITQDGSDVTNSFADFEITFNGTSYTSSGGGDVWPDGVNAPWIFAGNDPEDASTIIREDEIEVQISVSKGQQLTLTFILLPVGSGGRSSGLNGNYFFDLKSVQ